TVALGRNHAVKADAHSVVGATASNDARNSESLDPDFSVGQPEADFHLGSGLDRGSGFDEASTDAGVGEVTPDGRGGVIHAELYGNETLNAGMAAAVAAEIWAEQVRLKRRRRCGR